MEIKRLFVEKIKGCDIKAQNYLEDINKNLLLPCVTGLRILVRYDIEGISDEEFNAVKNTIFSEPNVDMVYEDEFIPEPDETMFAVEYLPGQYDQRADSAVQCVQLVVRKTPLVATAEIFVLKGNILPLELQQIKNYFINPVDSREGTLKKPKSLALETETPADVISLEGFNQMTKEEMGSFRDKMELAMSLNDLLFCQEYFRDTEKREPTLSEIKVLDTYWSDHCRHTTFLTEIETIKTEDGYFSPMFNDAQNLYLSEKSALGSKSNICLMDIAVMGMKALREKGLLCDLDKSDEINACSINVMVDVDGIFEDWLILFKNETHNHPTEIEPFGGAATCLGGAIRDPLSGRAYVYQAMRITGSADPRASVSETIKGKLPQRKITTEAARGYSSYGNQIGLATGLVKEVYHPGFVAKRMEIGAVIGAVKKTNVVRKTPSAGDKIILVGGRTGRDGCGGATGSSKKHDLCSILNCGAEVQKGNPPTERKLQRLFRNPKVSHLIKRCNDFGAGGVSVAIGELADGVLINLDLVPKKYDGLDGTELAISESQERMAVVVEEDKAKRFIDFAAEENLEATVVASVTDNRRLTMLWRGKKIIDISRDFLDTNGATQKTNVFIKQPERIGCFEKSLLWTKENPDLTENWLKNLKNLNCANQKGLSERFDSTIGAGTVLMPFGGKNQLTPPEAMSAKIPLVTGETETATLMSYGYNPEISSWSPFHGAHYAVIESVSKIVAAGGNHEKVRLTFQEYFEKLGDDPEKWGKPYAALLGAFDAQMKLEIPSIGGKDSMSGTFMDISVPPTLVSFAVTAANLKNIISPEFKKPDNSIIYLPARRNDFNLLDFDYFKKTLKLLESLIEQGICISAKSIGKGGLALSLSEMSLGNHIGAAISVPMSEEDLFSSEYGAFVVELSSAKVIDFMGIDAQLIGKTITEEKIILKAGEEEKEILLSEIEKAYLSPLSEVFPYKTPDIPEEKIDVPFFEPKEFKLSRFKVPSPRVLIPVFPGTNCEYDSMRAFKKAGAQAETFVISNLTLTDLEDSIKELERRIRNSQIIMLPGGFSAGDEPDGSGKFIAAIFRNPAIKDAVTELLEKRDGLMLGICNGFQALIKLGLLPYGEICDISKESPTLTFNNIGRHMSCFVNTKIVSTLSPWLWETKPKDIHSIPISHGEGRFMASPEALAELIKNNQIATQYVDKTGKPSLNMPYNPNGSAFAIEGITSPNGKVFGKMGHSERIGPGLYKNIPGNKDQRIFESGVNYFK